MEDIINAVKTSDNGFLETRNGIKVLHISGRPYERGYQHGFLLAREISEVIPDAITGAASVIAKACNCSMGQAIEIMQQGKEAAEGYIPPEFKEEMRGIANGMVAAGSTLDYDDIVLWNTMYDQWCFYARPDLSDPKKDSARHAYPPGCSSFSAWGEATVNGRMVFGKNMDNLDIPGTTEHRILAIVKPDRGYGHAFITHPGMIAIDGGINEDGVEMMTHRSSSANETLKGCGIGILSRLILANAHRVEDAINILTVYPRCTGINYHVADAKARAAVVVEVSATEIAVRYPQGGKDMLWTANHYNCYPGWRGYEGYNMVENQAPVLRMPDVGTIEKWQESLNDTGNPYISGAGRFVRYEQLLDEHYGRIDEEVGKRILGDRVDPYTGKERDWQEAHPGRNYGVTICMYSQAVKYADDVQFYKSRKRGSFSARISNLWSMVSILDNGDFWVAMKDFPAPRGGYELFNLRSELSRF